ncbi:MAG: ribosome biogenesis GTPase YlqF [Firmicutes bacterium]|nr:ribosome biogenesis GTPase YlqF [Bacillota bacterium]
MAQESMNIQWYPGHMTKTRRQIEADLKQVDAVCEIVDARIPISSRNPDIDAICGDKPRIVILNRLDLADPAATRRWAEAFRRKGIAAVATDCKNRKGIADFQPAVRQVLQEKLRRNAVRGMNRPLRVMVVGIPNVGKSTLINQIAGRKGAKAENRPGVTRGKQWITVDSGLLLLDTPGILWPKFEDPQVGMMLSYTGAVKDDILDLEALACQLMELLHQRYPQALMARYGVEAPPLTPGYTLLEMAGRKRGFLVSGGEIHTERMAKVLLEEFRSGKLGRFTLEEPMEDAYGGKESLGN